MEINRGPLVFNPELKTFTQKNRFRVEYRGELIVL
jgi:hypothetical protein